VKAPRSHSLSRIVAASLIITVASALLFSWWKFAPSWDTISQYRDAARGWIDTRPLEGAALFFLLYLAVAAFSIPVASGLTIVGGSLFGLFAGTLLVLAASVAGATLAMLSARYLLRDVVRQKFQSFMAHIDNGMERDGARYLFGLRLVPAIPFFVLNLTAGLTHITLWTFIWVSAIGMLPTTMIYANAGNQLMSIKSAADLLSWPIVLALVALALAPFVARMLLTSWSSRKAYARWERPRHADYNLVVIGAGSAGLVAAYAAATAKAKVGARSSQY
jgi:uncharacterized membrane protein YdjX (TVP38/TMEM64 family)